MNNLELTMPGPGTGKQQELSTSLRSLIMLATWFGLITGFGELTLLITGKYLLNHFIRFGPHVIWMAPLADLLLFIVVALFLAALGLPWPRLITLRRVSFVFVSLGFMSLLYMYSPLHHYAATFSQSDWGRKCVA